MAQNPDEHFQRERTGLALAIGGLLTLAGIIIILGPLVYSILAKFPPPPEIKQGMDAAAYLNSTTHPLTRLNANFSFFLFTGCILLAFGLTFLFSHAVDYSAVGAGKMKILGLEMPVEFQGGVTVLIILLAGMGYVIQIFELTKLDETWRDWTKYTAGLLSEKTEEEEDLETLGEKYSTLSKSHSELTTKYELIKDRSSIFEKILVGNGQSLKLQFNCSDEKSQQMVVNWEEQHGRITGSLQAPTTSDTSEKEDDRIKPFMVLGPMPSKTYTIVASASTFPAFAGGKRDKVDVISANFEFLHGNLVASIWPGDVSLRELCDSQKLQAQSSEEVFAKMAPEDADTNPISNAVDQAAQAKAGN